MRNQKEYYQRMKRRARDEAIEFSYHGEEMMKKSDKSIFEWAEHFWKLARRYGLVQEFIENGIL